MAQSGQGDADAAAGYSGEVWTDARGLATVTLPEPAQWPAGPVGYVLRDLEGRVEVRLKTELEDGRFTIESDEPHVKVAWRLTGHRRAGDRRRRQPEGEEDK